MRSTKTKELGPEINLLSDTIKEKLISMAYKLQVSPLELMSLIKTPNSVISDDFVAESLDKLINSNYPTKHEGEPKKPTTE